jgi:flagellar motor switch/type III secretory pathway protein FliN
MILVYRPELENPPMDKECTIGFSFVGGGGLSEHIQINAGVTRNFPEAIWEKIQDYDVVKNLLKLGALRIETEEKATTEPASAGDVDSLHDIPIALALELIEASFDLEQLRRWEAKEQRIKVRNSIGKRITAITEGNG